MVPTSEEYGCTLKNYGSTSKNLLLQRIPSHVFLLYP